MRSPKCEHEYENHYCLGHWKINFSVQRYVFITRYTQCVALRNTFCFDIDVPHRETTPHQRTKEEHTESLVIDYESTYGL